MFTPSWTNMASCNNPQFQDSMSYFMYGIYMVIPQHYSTKKGPKMLLTCFLLVHLFLEINHFRASNSQKSSFYVAFSRSSIALKEPTLHIYWVSGSSCENATPPRHRLAKPLQLGPSSKQHLAKRSKTRTFCENWYHNYSKYLSITNWVAKKPWEDRLKFWNTAFVVML